MIPVVVEGVVEGFELFKGNYGEQGIPYQREVFGPSRISFRRAILSPVCRVSFPVVEVFDTPMAADDPAKLGRRFFCDGVGAAKNAHRHLGFGSFFGRAINAGAFQDGGNVRKGANFGIHCHDGEVPDFPSSMAAL